MPYTDLRHKEVENELGLLRLKSAECIWDVSGEVRVSLGRALTELIDGLMAGGDVLLTPTVGHSEGGSFSTSLFGKSVFCFKTILFIQMSSQSFCVIKKWKHRTPADRIRHFIGSYTVEGAAEFVLFCVLFPILWLCP